MKGLALVNVSELTALHEKLDRVMQELHISRTKPEGYINSDQACEYFAGITKETLISWVEKDIIPGHKVPGVRGWFFKYSELEQSVKSKDELKKYRVRL